MPDIGLENRGIHGLIVPARGRPARLNRSHSHAKGQILGVPMPKAVEDARAPSGVARAY